MITCRAFRVFRSSKKMYRVLLHRHLCAQGKLFNNPNVTLRSHIMTRSTVRLIPVSLLLIVGPVLANCSDDGYETQLTGLTTPTISSVLSGNSVDANAPDGENWKEIHCSAGALQKVGQGVGDPVDPQRVVGTWSTSGNTVTYTYTGLPSYNWTFWWDEDNTVPGTTYCWENPSDNATIATGNTGTVPCI